MLLGKLELFSISGLMILNLQRIVNMKICYRLTNNPLGDTHTFFFFTLLGILLIFTMQPEKIFGCLAECTEH